VLRRGQGLPPLFPAPLSPLAAFFPSLRSGQISLDEAEHFFHNRGASVATLRRGSGNHPGMPFRFGNSVRLSRDPHRRNTCRAEVPNRICVATRLRRIAALPSVAHFANSSTASTVRKLTKLMECAERRELADEVTHAALTRIPIFQPRQRSLCTILTIQRRS